MKGSEQILCIQRSRCLFVFAGEKHLLVDRRLAGVNKHSLRAPSAVAVQFRLRWTARKDQHMRTFAMVLLFSCATGALAAGDLPDINTTLMHWTFRINGPAPEPGKTTVGTVFVVGEPITNQPSMGRYVMVTAAHVLSNIAGDKATLGLRLKDDKGRYQPVPYEVRIRENGKDLWMKHPQADVAAMYVELPSFMQKHGPMFGANLLVDDKRMLEFEIHPGDELLCLGFPNGQAANDMGFPILRSGKIASYPLTPAKEIGPFLYDFEVFEGNSGGPVYFRQTGRLYGGSVHVDVTIQFIAGLVSQQKSTIERKVTPIEITKTRRRFEVQEEEERLRIGVVVPSEFITETLVMLREKGK